MIYLIRGADELAKRRRLQQLKDEADAGSGMLSTNLSVLEGREATPDAILGPAMTPPFLSPRRIVIVESFFDRWDGRDEGRGARDDTRGAREGRTARQIEGFSHLFAAIQQGLPPTTMLIFTGSSGRSQNPMAKRLAELPGAKDEVYDLPTKENLTRFIREEGATRGIRFRSVAATDAHPESAEWLRRSVNDPIALIATVTNGNTLMIANELDKLALYTMGREVTVDEVYAVCSGARDVNDFALLDAIGDGNLGEALAVLDKRWEELHSSQLILTLLGTRYRQVGVILDALDEGASPEEVGKLLGNAGSYAGLRDAAIRRAKRLGQGGLRAAFEAIVGADRDNKSGLVEERVGLEILVSTLARLGGTR